MYSVDPCERIIRNANLETRYGADDFINPQAFEPNPRQDWQKAYVLLDGGFVIAIVFSEYYAYTEQDAIDEAVDRGKLDRFQVSQSELVDYQIGTDGEGNPEYERLAFLGNASEPFDIETLDIWTLPASLFAEETCLMSHERVMDRLEEVLDRAEALYKSTDVESPDWLKVYNARGDARDAHTLARLTGRR